MYLKESAQLSNQDRLLNLLYIVYILLRFMNVLINQLKWLEIAIK